MLGLFIVLPVLTLAAADFDNASATMIGLAIGIYGLFQALLQVPFGFLSDRIGRKPVIIGGLLIFLIGSVLAALATDVHTLIFARALQGSGAISATLTALAADLTRDEQRTKITAMIGVTIGLSFMIAIAIGPMLSGVAGISGSFWFTAVCALAAVLLVVFLVPTPARMKQRGDWRTGLRALPALLRDRQLLRLDASVFVLHLLITATFVVTPLLLVQTGLAAAAHWKVYLPAMVGSLLVMVPLLIMAERKRRFRDVFLLCIAGMAVALGCMLVAGKQLYGLFAAVLILFCFVNTLEALLPSLASRLVPLQTRGAALGVYSSSQFLGAFVGGAGGGLLFDRGGALAVIVTLIVFCIGWAFLMLGLLPLPNTRSELFQIDSARASESQAGEWIEQLRELPGVLDVSMVLRDEIAYLKVDPELFERDAAARILPLRST